MDLTWIYDTSDKHTDKNGNRKKRLVLPRAVAAALGLKRNVGTYDTIEDALEERDKLRKKVEGLNLITDRRKVTRRPISEIENDPDNQIPDEPLDEMEDVDVRVLTASKDIKTVDELLDYFKIDQEVWDIERHLVNKWPTTMKGPDKLPIQVNNFQIKVWLRHKLGGINLDELAEYIAERTPRAEVLDEFVIPEDPHALEINIPDLHYGQLCWAPESGEHYDSKIAADRFMAAINRLLGLAGGFNIERIYFPIGHDFFNTDTPTDTTTAGTPQHNDGRWQKMYQEGVGLLIEAVDMLRRYAPVEVILVQGNHDYERSYCGALHLDAYFRDDPNVNVNWQPVERKYYQYGDNMIVHTHGNGPKKGDWLGIVASEEPEMWGRTKFREVHMGHYHHLSVEENHGLVTRFLGSLSATDAWHYHKGFVGARKSAHAFIYHPKQGPIVNTTYHIV